MGRTGSKMFIRYIYICIYIYVFRYHPPNHVLSCRQPITCIHSLWIVRSTSFLRDFFVLSRQHRGQEWQRNATGRPWPGTLEAWEAWVHPMGRRYLGVSWSGGSPKWIQMDGLSWKILLKWMIWWYPISGNLHLTSLNYYTIFHYIILYYIILYYMYIILYYMYIISGWWFQTFFLFSISNMGCHPSNWLSYFTRWLKPPTSDWWLIDDSYIKLLRCFNYIYIYISCHLSMNESHYTYFFDAKHGI